MFDKLINFIIAQINNFLPFFVIYQYQIGVRFRFGRLCGIMKPGLHFKIPWVDTKATENCVDTTTLLPAQSIITSDGKELIVKGAIGYKIVDMIKFFCAVYDTKSALCDRASVIIREVMSECTFEQCKDVCITDTFLALTQEAVSRYGIEVQFVALVDITNSRSFRLFNEIAQVSQ